MAINKLNISQLADMTGISRNTITKIYHEKGKRIDFKTINTLCNFFKCSPSDLLVVTELKYKGNKIITSSNKFTFPEINSTIK